MSKFVRPPIDSPTLIDQLQKQVKAGQDFKTYVHQRLDDLGVPHSIPESEHDKAGCRIGGRLDWVASELAAPKQGQGEPVATVEEKRIVEHVNLPVGTDLYTTPATPAGWQLMDMGWLRSMLHVNALRMHPEKSHEEITEAVDKVIAAAPK